MPNKYFKPHEAFDLNPHPYDIGIFTRLKNGCEDNLFVKKLFTQPQQDYPDFYEYRLILFKKLNVKYLFCVGRVS